MITECIACAKLSELSKNSKFFSCWRELVSGDQGAKEPIWGQDSGGLGFGQIQK
jgi:hypothetical protein